MKRLFVLASAAVLFGTGIVGCGNTSEGMKEDATKDTAAVKQAGDAAAAKTVQGTEKAVAATEKGVANAGAAVEQGVANAGTAVKDAGVTVEKGVANAGVAVEKGVANAGAAVEKTTAEAGKMAEHTGKVLTVTPTVKTALLNDKMLFPPDNPSLSSINVDTGSDGATIVLKGTVPTNDLKKHAGEVAKAASPGSSYKVDNQLMVAKH